MEAPTPTQNLTVNPGNYYLSVLPVHVQAHVLRYVNAAKAIPIMDAMSCEKNWVKVEWLNETQYQLPKLKLMPPVLEAMVKNHGTDLKYLGLNRGDASSLCSPVEYATNLTELKVTVCEHGEAIPGMFRYLNPTRLLSLRITNNTIGEFDSARLAAFTNLTSLTYRNNNVVPKINFEALTALKQLRTLYMDQEKLFTLVHHFPELTAISVSGIEIVPDFSTLIQLTTLKLHWVAIGHEGIANISSLVNLKKLRLTNIKQGYRDPAVDEIPKKISTLTNLTFLNLGENNISEHGLTSLSNLAELTTLKLTGSLFKGIWPLDSLTKLKTLAVNVNRSHELTVQTFSKLSGLTAINLHLCCLKNLEGISSLDQLTDLNLMQNGLKGEELAPLTNLSKLAILNLYGNELGFKGAAILSKMTTLTNLDISSCKIPELFIIARMTNLTSLKLNNNEQIHYDLPSVWSMPHLIELECHGCSNVHLTDEHAPMIKTLTHFDVLKLSAPKMKKETKEELKQFFLNKPTEFWI